MTPGKPDDGEYLFTDLLIIWISSLEKCLWRFSPLLKLDYHFYWVESSFIYSAQQAFVRYVICNYFLPFWGLSFHFLNNALWSTEVLSLMKSSLFFSFVACVFCHVQRNHCFIQGHEDLQLCVEQCMSFFLVAVSCGLWDSTSPIRDRTPGRWQWGHQVLTIVLPGNSHRAVYFLNKKIFFTTHGTKTLWVVTQHSHTCICSHICLYVPWSSIRQ